MFNLRDRLPKAMSLIGFVASCSLAGCGGGGSPGSLPAISNAVSPTLELSRRRDTSSNFRKMSDTGGYGGAVLADEPLAYYQLNDTSSTLSDSGPSRINGTYGSDVSHTAAPLTSGSNAAAGFPGGQSYDANGFAYTPASSTLQPAVVSVEVWFKLSAAYTNSRDVPIAVYGKASDGVRYGFFLHRLGGAGGQLLYIQANSGRSSSVQMYSNTDLNVGTTYHAVATSDGKNTTMYINGSVDQSTGYAGSIDYSRGVQNGLQIGDSIGSADHTAPPFPGTIAEVAVYGSALSSARISAHYLAGQGASGPSPSPTPSVSASPSPSPSSSATASASPHPSPSATPTSHPSSSPSPAPSYSPGPGEVPVQADKFVDSIGVNAHFERSHSPYFLQFNKVSGMLVAANIRHVRVGIDFNNAQHYWPLMNQLASAGIHAVYTTSLDQTQSQLQSLYAGVTPSLEAFEAPNEQNDQGNPNWVGPCIAFEKNLWSWIKHDSATANIPVIGPAMTDAAAFQAVSSLEPYMDYGNIHNYFGNRNPGVVGYASIPYNIGLGRAMSGSKPIMATETGWGTKAGLTGEIDDRTQLRYMTRLWFEQYMGGIVRTFSYDLIDDNTGGSSVFDNYGIIDDSVNPKPAYNGIKNVNALLADPGASFQPSPLVYNLGGSTSNVQHLLLQKRDGSYVLALWIETASWDKHNGGDIYVPAQNVSFATSRRFSSASLYTMDENGNLSPSNLSLGSSGASFNVTDKVSLITLRP